MYYLGNGLFSQAPFGMGILDIADKSCFNAFSRVDMRVEVKIPGGVKTHVIDERGNKYGSFSSRSHSLDKKQQIKCGWKHLCQA